jgi:hypothetical protein
MTLLQTTVMAPIAMSSTKACAQLQAMCASNTDWRFRFGAVHVLLMVAQGTQEAEVLSSIVRGALTGGRTRRRCILAQLL